MTALMRPAPTVAPLLGVAVVVGSFGSVAAVRSDPRMAPYAVVSAVLISVGVAVDRWARFSSGVRWALVASLGLHLAGGLALPAESGLLYERWIVPGAVRVDQAIHLVVTAVLATACLEVLERLAAPNADRHRRALLVVAGISALGLGAINEVVEFISAQRLDHLAVGGGHNTGWDLVFNLGGALTAILWWGITGRDGAYAGRPNPRSSSSSA